MTGPQGQLHKEFTFTSTGFSLLYFEALGKDEKGNIYVQFVVQPEDSADPLSLLVVALSPEGEKLGQLWLGTDQYVSEDVYLGADGTIYEMRSDKEDGVSVYAYRLGPDSSLGLGATVDAGLERMQALAWTLVTYDARMVELASQINSTLPNIPQSVSDELQSMVEVTESGLADLDNDVPVHLEYADAYRYLHDAAVAMWTRVQATLNGVDAIRESGSVSAGNDAFAQGRYQRDRFREVFKQYQASLPGAQTTPTAAADLFPLSEIGWPSRGLQPDAVMEVLHQQLWMGLVPIYLPKTLPRGFYAGPDYVFEYATGGHLPNPQVWNQILGEHGGYGVTFTDGADTVTLWVNPAADAGEGEWQETDIIFENGFFSFQEVAPAFLTAVGANRSVVVVSGTRLDAVREVARRLVRVE